MEIVHHTSKNLFFYQPCPHCGKDNKSRWCYGLKTDSGSILSVCKRQAEPANGWESINRSDSEGYPYYAQENENGRTSRNSRNNNIKVNSMNIKSNNIMKHTKKQASHSYFTYRDVDGIMLVRSVREDYFDKQKNRWDKKIYQQKWNGNSWVSGGTDYTQVPLYNYEAVRDAIKAGELIWVVEGEKLAERLINMGLVATTNLGGSAKWQKHHTESLKGAKLVLCPDRDMPGMRHMNGIYRHFPNASWCYAFPDEDWSDVPKDNGVDLEDWIVVKDLKVEDLINNLQDAPRRADEPKDLRDINFDHQRPDRPTMTDEEIKTEANRIWERFRKTGQFELEVKRFSERINWASAEVKSLIRGYAEEYNEAENFQDSLEFVGELMDLRQKDICPKQIFPEPLAQALLDKAENLSVHPIRLIQYLWPALTTVIGSKFYVEGKLKDTWKEWFTFFTCDIGNPSSGKTQAMKAVFNHPLGKQKTEEMRYDARYDAFEEVQDSWRRKSAEEKEELKDTDANPSVYKRNHLKKKMRIFNMGTTEALLKCISQQQSDRGVTMMRDELAGMFAAQNQYKPRGKGDDRQTILEMWNGSLMMSVDLKTEGKSTYLKGQVASITGGIQSSVLKQHINLEKDHDGLASRFLYANPPLHPDRCVWKDKTCNIDEVLGKLYEGLDRLVIDWQDDENGISQPIREALRLSPQAQAHFIRQWERQQRHRDKHEYQNPAFASYLAKLLSYMLRLAGAIHLIDCVFYESSLDLHTITLSALQRAIVMCNYYAYQFLLVQGTADSQNMTGGNALQGLLLDIWISCEHESKISTRDVCRRFKRKVDGEMMNAVLALKLLAELEKAGYGRLEGKILHFVPVSRNGDSIYDPLKDLQDKGYEDVSEEERDIDVEGSYESVEYNTDVVRDTTEEGTEKHQFLASTVTIQSKVLQDWDLSGVTQKGTDSDTETEITMFDVDGKEVVIQDEVAVLPEFHAQYGLDGTGLPIVMGFVMDLLVEKVSGCVTASVSFAEGALEKVASLPSNAFRKLDFSAEY